MEPQLKMATSKKMITFQCQLLYKQIEIENERAGRYTENTATDFLLTTMCYSAVPKENSKTIEVNKKSRNAGTLETMYRKFKEVTLELLQGTKHKPPGR